MSGIFSRSEQVNWTSDDTILIRTQRRFNISFQYFSMGCLLWILEKKSDRVITALHCIALLSVLHAMYNLE